MHERFWIEFQYLTKIPSVVDWLIDGPIDRKTKWEKDSVAKEGEQSLTEGDESFIFFIFNYFLSSTRGLASFEKLKNCEIQWKCSWTKWYLLKRHFVRAASTLSCVVSYSISKKKTDRRSDFTYLIWLCITPRTHLTQWCRLWVARVASKQADNVCLCRITQHIIMVQVLCIKLNILSTFLMLLIITGILLCRYVL